MQLLEGPGDLKLAFSTPILMRTIPEAETINPGLAEMLRAERNANPRPSASSIRGWQSKTDLAVRGTPELIVLRDAVYQAVAEMTATDLGRSIAPGDLSIEGNGWGNILSSGGLAHQHNHAREADWSAVYFVDAEAGDPDVEMNGYLMLADPRAVQVISGEGPYRQAERHVFIRPVNGMMVLFPAWVQHQVIVYFGGRERISVAFNARVGIAPGGKPD